MVAENTILLAKNGAVTQKWPICVGQMMKTMDFEFILSLAFGAIFGLLLRTLSFAIIGHQFYLLNFLVDLGGSFFIGFLFTNVSLKPDCSDKICLILVILGGLATFSGFAVDIFNFVQIGEFKRAFFYFIITNLLAIAGCFLGSHWASPDVTDSE